MTANMKMTTRPQITTVTINVSSCSGLLSNVLRENIAVMLSLADWRSERSRDSRRVDTGSSCRRLTAAVIILIVFCLVFLFLSMHVYSKFLEIRKVIPQFCRVVEYM